MIEISKMKEKERMLLEKTASEYEIKLNKEEITDNCLILKEDDVILGFGYYAVLDSTAWVKKLNIFIDDEENQEIYRDLLLRALMNSAELKGLDYIRINEKNISSNIKKRMNYKSIGHDVLLNIKDFFAMPCSCKK